MMTYTIAPMGLNDPNAGLKVKVFWHLVRYSGTMNALRRVELIDNASETQLHKALDRWVLPTIEEALGHEKADQTSDITSDPAA